VVGFAALRRRVRPGVADEVHDAIIPPGVRGHQQGLQHRRSGVNEFGVIAGMPSVWAQRGDRPHRVMPGQDVAGLPPEGSLVVAGSA
jgi:hypothetical protein